MKRYKMYYENLIKAWISAEINPLEIPIIKDIIDNKLLESENRLIKIEQHLSKNNLLLYMDELKGQNAPDQVMQKLKSLDYETYVYNELVKKNNNIKKINQIGDWETDKEVISVKSILNLDFNYQIIENFLISLFYIKEYEIIRKYNSIRIAKIKNFDYKFRNTVLCFLRENLVKIIEKYDKTIFDIPFAQEIIENYNENLRIIINSYINDKPNKEISIFFNYNYKDYSELEIIFNSDIFNNILYAISYDTNAFIIESSNFNEGYVIKQIIDKVEKLNEDYKKLIVQVENKKHFEGWITLSRHTKDEEYFLKNEKLFLDKIRIIRNNLDYKIYLSIIPQWSFNSEIPKIYEI